MSWKIYKPAMFHPGKDPRQALHPLQEPKVRLHLRQQGPSDQAPREEVPVEVPRAGVARPARLDLVPDQNPTSQK
jgi:hypothetical protein